MVELFFKTAPFKLIHLMGKSIWPPFTMVVVMEALAVDARLVRRVAWKPVVALKPYVMVDVQSVAVIRLAGVLPVDVIRLVDAAVVAARPLAAADAACVANWQAQKRGALVSHCVYHKTVGFPQSI